MSCDYKAAEPTILFHALRQKHLLTTNLKPDDIYQQVASLRGIERRKAKQEFLSLVYSPWKNISIPADWRIPQTHDIQFIVAAVEKYRQHLWEQGKPTLTERRHTVTFTGRTIRRNHRENMHRGKLLSWHLQGTLADIFLKVLNRVLDAHDAGQLRFCLQLHDSIIVAVPEGAEDELQRIMQEETSKAGIPIHAESTTQGQSNNTR